jgi:acetyl esterase/lipase
MHDVGEKWSSQLEGPFSRSLLTSVRRACYSVRLSRQLTLAWSTHAFAANPDIHVNAQTPPSFILRAEDDLVHLENSTVYFLELKNANVPVEMDLFAKGGHGYGLRRAALPVTHWPEFVETRMHAIDMLPPARR